MAHIDCNENGSFPGVSTNGAKRQKRTFFKLNYFWRKTKYEWIEEEAFISTEDFSCNKFNEAPVQLPGDAKTFKDPPKENEKKKSFLKSAKNIILLKKWRKTRKSYKGRDFKFESLITDTDIPYEIDDASSTQSNETFVERFENVPETRGHNDNYDGRRKRKSKEETRTNSFEDLEDVLGRKPEKKKKKTIKKRASKVTKNTGKTIGKSVLYTSAAMQYIAPAGRPAPQREWKRWRERSQHKTFTPTRDNPYAYV